MQRFGSPRRKHVAIAVVLLVIVQLFAVLVSGFGARASSVSGARDAIQREGNTVVESILRHLDPAEQSVDVTARLLTDSLIDTTSPGLEQYLFTQLAVMPQMTGAFIGYPDGSFVFVSLDGDGFQSKRIETGLERTVEIRTYDRDFTLTSVEEVFDDVYNPTERPWFEDAAAADELIWTDPYVFFSSRQPGVTASRAVRADGELVAVVGVDVELSGLTNFLDNLAVAKSGEAFVTSAEHVVGAPSAYIERTMVDADGDIHLLTTEDLGLGVFASDQPGEVERVDTGDGHDLVLALDFPDDQRLEWVMIIRAPESAFTAIASRQQTTALLITIGGALLVFGAIFVLFRTTRPLNDLQTAATTDPLTGLANRRYLYDSGAQLCDHLDEGNRISVLTIDLDRFKSLNDVDGHHAGDGALRAVGEELRANTRPGDLLGRPGGDEFVVVQNVDSIETAIDRANHLLTVVTQRLRSEFPEAQLGATGGLTVSDEQLRDFTMLLRESDTALITGKGESKGMLQLSERLVQSAI